MNPPAHDPNTPLDPHLRAWLLGELERRELPVHWAAQIRPLIEWAATHRDGKTLHALLTTYPRRSTR